MSKQLSIVVAAWLPSRMAYNLEAEVNPSLSRFPLVCVLSQGSSSPGFCSESKGMGAFPWQREALALLTHSFL